MLSVEFVFHMKSESRLLDKSTLSPSQNVVADKGVMIGVGRGFTVMEVPVELATQLSVFVTVTVYIPVVSTVMNEVVSPVFHK